MRIQSLTLLAATLTFAALSTLGSIPAQAGVSPLAFALINPVELPPADFTITGARVSVLWGTHRDVYGVDLGAIGNITTGDFAGIGVSGGFNKTAGTTTIVAAQVAGVGNFNSGKVHALGVQVAVGVNSNSAESSLIGVQVAAVNLCPFTSVTGVQAGLYNRAGNVYGFQVGLINDAEMLHGVQIGLVNFNRRGLFAFTPILNVGF